LQTPLSFSALAGGQPFRLYGKAFRILKQVFQAAADGEDLVILPCTVFDWSTCVMDGQTDKQRNCDGEDTLQQ